MTGFLNLGFGNPLSVVTIGSLQDLGYSVDYGTSEPFAVGAGMRRDAATPTRQLREVPLKTPVIVLRRDGTPCLAAQAGRCR